MGLHSHAASRRRIHRDREQSGGAGAGGGDTGSCGLRGQSPVHEEEKVLGTVVGVFHDRASALNAAELST